MHTNSIKHRLLKLVFVGIGIIVPFQAWALPAGSRFTAARPVNLRGEPTGVVVPINNQILRFPLKGNAPASFLFK